jgi:hypothetical protein
VGIHDFAFGPPPGEYPNPEQVLKEYGLRSIDQYLSYWAWHNEQILEAVPSGRRLLLQTSALSHRIEEIAAFAEVPTAHLSQDQSHAHKTSEKHHVLDRVSDGYVASKIASTVLRSCDA